MGAELPPANPETWDGKAKKYRQLPSLHSASVTVTKSGSQIGQKQFMLLRAIWPIARKARDFEQACVNGDLLVSENLEAARRCLHTLPSWMRYLEAFDGAFDTATGAKPAGRIAAKHQGTFALVRHYQQLTCKRAKAGSVAGLPKVEFTRTTRSMTAARARSDAPTTPTRAPKHTGVGPDASSITDAFSRLDIRSGDRASATDGDSEDEAEAETEDETEDKAEDDDETEDEDEDETEDEDEDETEDEADVSPLSNVSPLTGVAAREFGAVEDEQIVNMALILFLNALTLHCEAMGGEWTVYRHPFVMSGPKSRKIYEARVDGLLRKNDSNEPQIIVEVKPVPRNKTTAVARNIRMQEAAQMAAWICQYPPRQASAISAGKATAPIKYRRLLISQDAKEIYTTVAEFDSDYVDYVRGKKEKIESFLVMQEYGPFPVDNKKSISSLGEILLGFSIQGGLRESHV